MAVGGRPTKITSSVVAKLEQSLEGGCTITKACSTAGISYDAYHERYRVDVEFRQKMDIAKDSPTETARQVMVTAIKGGDVAVAKWWLERKAANEFGTKPVPPPERPPERLPDPLKGKELLDSIKDFERDMLDFELRSKAASR